jgi:Ni,Fe-hydrogenase III large subunit
MNAIVKVPTQSAILDQRTISSIEELSNDFERRGVAIRPYSAPGLTPALSLEVYSKDWGVVAETAHHHGFRWVGGWAMDVGSEIGIQSSLRLTVLACFEGDGRYLLFRTILARGQTDLPSQTPWFPGANRSERHTRDAFGIQFINHHDSRPWLRHQAWKPDQYPLRKTFPAAGFRESLANRPTTLKSSRPSFREPASIERSNIVPPDTGYIFQTAQGSGVYEIPVGPVHAGIIEPGHFRFLAVGETVLNLEERLGYVHKGIEKIAEGRSPEGLARLAGRVSGDTTVAHTWAACMAMERATQIEVPERGQLIRGILAERERIANHLGDIGALCNDVAFAFAHYQFSRLRELWLRNHHAWFGHRLLMDLVVPGGVARDLSLAAAFAMMEELTRLRTELRELRPILDENGSLEDRLVAAGVLPHSVAQTLGCLGYVARASGVDFDLRRDAPYAPYDRITVRAICRQEGDVAARLKVRYDEIEAALDLIDQLLRRLREGEIRAPWTAPNPHAEGLGLVEGWRGEILCYVRFAENNRIDRYYPRDPSLFNWPALERLIHGNIVPDFPLCNKSVNGSYSGHDL